MSSNQTSKLVILAIAENGIRWANNMIVEIGNNYQGAFSSKAREALGESTLKLQVVLDEIRQATMINSYDLEKLFRIEDRGSDQIIAHETSFNCEFFKRHMVDLKALNLLDVGASHIHKTRHEITRVK